MPSWSNPIKNLHGEKYTKAIAIADYRRYTLTQGDHALSGRC